MDISNTSKGLVKWSLPGPSPNSQFLIRHLGWGEGLQREHPEGRAPHHLLQAAQDHAARGGGGRRKNRGRYCQVWP